MKLCVALAVIFLAHYVTGDSRVKRIVGGNPVPVPGQQCSAPYIVIVSRFCDGRTTPEVGRCAGTIIDNNFILTSSHCVRQADGCTTLNRIEVIAGAQQFNLLDNTPQDRLQLRNTQLEHVHTNPTVPLSVVFIDDEAFTPNAYVSAASVPESPAQILQQYRALGWGRTQYVGGIQYPATLKYVNDLTVRQVADNFLTMSRNLGDTAGVNEGDTGGPIIRYADPIALCNGPEIMGVIGCIPNSPCQQNQTADHANVFNFRDWIQEIKDLYKEEEENGANGLHGIAAVVLSFLSVMIMRLL